jgi:hypothetical protein
LDNVSKLVGEELAAMRRGWLIPTSAENNVVADCKCLSSKGHRRCVGSLVCVHSDPAEVVPVSLFKELSSDAIELLAAI